MCFVILSLSWRPGSCTLLYRYGASPECTINQHLEVEDLEFSFPSPPCNLKTCTACIQFRAQGSRVIPAAGGCSQLGQAQATKNTRRPIIGEHTCCNRASNRTWMA